MTVQQKVFRKCQSAIPPWADLSFSDFDFDKPKGFSSFTMGVRSKKLVTPNAVLYRQLEGKEKVAKL